MLGFVLILITAICLVFVLPVWIRGIYLLFVILVATIFATRGEQEDEKHMRRALDIISSELPKLLPEKYRIVDITPLFHTITVDLRDADNERMLYRIIFYRISKKWGFVTTPMSVPQDLHDSLLDMLQRIK